MNTQCDVVMHESDHHTCPCALMPKHAFVVFQSNGKGEEHDLNQMGETKVKFQGTEKSKAEGKKKNPKRRWEEKGMIAHASRCSLGFNQFVYKFNR